MFEHYEYATFDTLIGIQLTTKDFMVLWAYAGVLGFGVIAMGWWCEGR